MKRQHKIVLLGPFTRTEIERTFKRRGVHIHRLNMRPDSGFHEGVICFNPNRISHRRIIEVLTATNNNDRIVGIDPIETAEETCHDCHHMA